MPNLVDGPEMPLGLGMALAQDIHAMNRFASLSHADQQAFISRTHSVQSKEEMQALVQELTR